MRSPQLPLPELFFTEPCSGSLSETMDSSTLAKASLVAAPLALPLLYKSSSSLLHNFVSKRTTVLHDLPDLGEPRADGRRIQGTAVVCGGR